MQTPPRSSLPATAGKRRGVRLSASPLARGIFIGVFVIAILAAAAALIDAATAQAITVRASGVTIETRTHQTTVNGVLGELRIVLDVQDRVTPPGDARISAGMLITVERASSLLVEADGQQQQILTRATDVRSILTQAGVSVGEHDQILVDNVPAQAGAYPAVPKTVVVVRALAIHIQDGNAESTVYTAHRTVGEALHDAGIALYVGDLVQPEPETALDHNTRIVIKRSVPIEIQVDGRKLITRTHGPTVNAALVQAGVGLIGLDYVIPDGDTNITRDMSIRIVRVTEEDIPGERKQLDYQRIFKPDPALPLDAQKVVQPGTTGIVEQHVRIRREDGLEVSRSPVENVLVQPAQDEIVSVGTRPTLQRLDTPDGPVDYWRKIKMQAASYKPSSTGIAPTDPHYGQTASGQKLRKGLVAVDPAVIPLGTRLYVPGYGLAEAADTGGAVRGLVIDLGYSDDDYKEWSGTVDVYLLPPIPPPDQIRIISEEKP